jgi:MFS family permease
VDKFSKEEEYIISESAEVEAGRAPAWTRKMFSVFPAFKSRNYQLYFGGQVVSLIGTWLQIVAEGWLVLQLTNSAFYVGLVAAVSTIPTLIFSLIGGVIADRFPKRKLLILTQIASMVLAFVLGGLSVSGVITIWQILIIAFLLGCVNAIDAPARQAFSVDLVEKEDLPSAIALNSAMFNSARVIGPGIAGFLIATIGTGGAFLANGASYIAVIIALLIIKTAPLPKTDHPHPIKAIKEGLSYSWNHPLIRSMILFTGVIAVFGWAYGTMLPVIAKNTFHMEATGLGYLYSASGIGAVIGTILISAFSKKIKSRTFIFGGITFFALNIIFFTLTSYFPLALIFMFLSGIGMLSAFSTINSSLQGIIEDKYRGRVMSIYSLVFMGFMPIGSIEIGFVSERFGTNIGIQSGALIVLAAAAILFSFRKKIRLSFKNYNLQSGNKKTGFQSPI